MPTFIAFKKNSAVILTKDYRTSFFGKVYKQGTSGIVTDIRRGWFSWTIDIRLKDGTVLRRVPYEYFRV